MSDGPRLDDLLRHLADCPDAFLAAPQVPRGDGVRVGAVVHDLLLDLGATAVAPGDLRAFAADRPVDSRRLALVGCWLLHAPWWRGRVAADAAAMWLRDECLALAELLAAERVIADPDRREEFIRLALAGLGFVPEGETAAQAEDRLRALDSGERRDLMRSMRTRLARARELRRKMAEDEAREAAARAGREW